jgi:hypothetical protein
VQRKEIAEAKVRPNKAFGDKGKEEWKIKPNQTIKIWVELTDYEELKFDW